MKAYDELRVKYNASIAHTFIFYGATFDFANDDQSLKSYLISKLSKNSNVPRYIICFDKADGIYFPTGKDEEKFKAVIGDALADFGGLIPKDTISAFELIGKALRKENFALIVNYAESVFPSGEMGSLCEADRMAIVSMLKWAKDDENIRNKGNIIILITSALSRINAMLREPNSRIETIGIPYPDLQERLSFIKNKVDTAIKDRSPIVMEQDMNVEFIARATAGLAKVHIVDIINRARALKTTLSIDLVRDRKNDIIKAEFEDILRIIEPRYGFDMIGGYEYVKDFFRKNIINPIKTGNYRRIPMGVLMMGPAGTGKTALAEALAYECIINFVSWNLGRMKERWVGASEEKKEKAIWAIKSIRPVIVFIDELDTAVSRSDYNGDGGVSNNQMKSLLEFMSDTSHRGEIIFLSATNRPEAIDFALKRTGRLDKKIPILPPSKKDIPFVYEAMLKKHNIAHSLSMETLSKLYMGDSKWDEKNILVGSDVEAIVLKAYEIAEDSGKETVDEDDIHAAITLIKPSVQDTAGMVASALRECNDISLLPEEYREGAIKAAQKDTASIAAREL